MIDGKLSVAWFYAVPNWNLLKVAWPTIAYL